MPKIKKISTEKIDIGKEASDLSVYSDGSLEQLDKEHKIKNHWLKERTILLLSVFVIITILCFCVLIISFSDEATSRDWGRQTLSALLGFSAGAIWQTKKKE